MPRPLTVRWQRLVGADGRTCPRCGSTEAELRSAVRKLAGALAPLGIEVKAVARPLSLAVFKRDPSSSNRIWVAGRPLEEWIGGAVGQSPCCGACGTSECRTLSLDGAEHEVIPARLILSAGLQAAARMLLSPGPRKNREFRPSSRSRPSRRR